MTTVTDHKKKQMPGKLFVDAVGRRIPLATTKSWYLPLKLVVDFIATLAMLALTAPVIFLAALLVKLTSPGPAFYCQDPRGPVGRLFTIYKLRSMAHNCESLYRRKVVHAGRFPCYNHWSPAPLDAHRRTSATLECLARRHEPGGASSRTSRVCPATGASDSPLPRPPVGQAWANRLGPSPTPTRYRPCQCATKVGLRPYYTRYLSFWLDVRVLVCTPLYVLGLPLMWAVRLFLVPPRKWCMILTKAPPPAFPPHPKFRRFWPIPETFLSWIV